MNIRCEFVLLYIKERNKDVEILINEMQLENLLLKKKNYIGRRNGPEEIIISITFLLPLLGASFEDFYIIPGIVLKILCILVSIFLFAKGVSSTKDKYGIKQLQEEIIQLNCIHHRFSLVAIKDTFDEYPNKFLLYYDRDWRCNFFPNYHTTDNNVEDIINKLSNELKIPKDNIKLEYKTMRIQEKFSERHKEKRVYEHILFNAKISDFPENLKDDKFEIDGKRYCWMSIAEMENDFEIKQRNMDVVSLVKENIG